MSKKMKDVMIIGFALFAMFFGAGNLIFPPALGQQSGTKVIWSTLGFLLTGVGLPLMGIMAVSKFGGSLENLAAKANKKFAILLSIVVILALGPLLAIPRTSATTYEMAIRPFIPNLNSIIFSIMYFTVVLFFVLKSTSIIDSIGKVLTPVLLLTLSTIIIKGILQPQGILEDTGMTGAFSTGFGEGYQTMDALGATVLATIVVSAIRDKGYKHTKEISKLTIYAGIVAAVGLAAVYGGLAYLGATSGNLPHDLSRPELIITITENLLGTTGTVLLGVAVGMACLTTSIGLTATVADYFSKLSKGRISFKTIAITTALISMIISNAGVDRITSLAVPLLSVVYPVIIVLVILGLLDQYITSNAIYRGAVFVTLIISLLDAINNLNITTPVIDKTLYLLPLASQGFGWLLPALGVGLSLHLVTAVKRKPQI